MCDHSIYILYSLSSKDLQRTLRKSSVRPVVNLSHAPKLFLMGLNSVNPIKTVRKCLGTPGRGGGVLPYMGYIGMCRCEGYGFQAVYSSIGYINQNVWVRIGYHFSQN